MRRGLQTIVCALALTGCAPMAWIKPGGTQDEFSQDRYGCLQASQQREARAGVSAYGGSAYETTVTNNDLFAACMNSRGWYWRPRSRP